MDLNSLKNSWQEQDLTLSSESEALEKVLELDKKLKKENLYISIAFSCTIFFLGFAVLPLLERTSTMLLVAALMFLMGFQAIAFWMRNVSVQNSISETPTTFINHLVNKLKYNLVVTNVIIPLYLLLLGSIMSFYIFDLLSGFEVNGLFIWMFIGLCWSFLAGLFLYAWPKQRAKDQTVIMPMITELEEVQKNYQ